MNCARYASAVSAFIDFTVPPPLVNFEVQARLVQVSTRWEEIPINVEKKKEVVVKHGEVRATRSAYSLSPTFPLSILSNRIPFLLCFLHPNFFPVLVVVAPYFQKNPAAANRVKEAIQATISLTHT